MKRTLWGLTAILIATILAAGPVQAARAAKSPSVPGDEALSQTPQVTFKKPAPNTFYRAGTAIEYKATALDPEDGELLGSAFTWQVDFHHGGNVDVFMQPASGSRSGSFTIPNTGNTETDVFYRISVTVMDSNGDSTTLTRDILPLISTLTVASNPAGIGIILDGVPATAPVTFDSVVGMQHSIGAESPLMKDDSLWAFKRWSDRGALIHTITAPASATTYTVTYKVKNILNPSFEIDAKHDGAADSWTFVNRYTTALLNEGLDCGSAAEGICSLKMFGNLSPSQEKQEIVLKGEAGDPYTLDFSTHAVGIGASQFSVELKLIYADGTIEQALYDYPAGTFDWTAQQLNITATKAYKTLWITIFASANSTGNIWADDFDLTLN